MTDIERNAEFYYENARKRALGIGASQAVAHVVGERARQDFFVRYRAKEAAARPGTMVWPDPVYFDPSDMYAITRYDGLGPVNTEFMEYRHLPDKAKRALQIWADLQVTVELEHAEDEDREPVGAALCSELLRTFVHCIAQYNYLVVLESPLATFRCRLRGSCMLGHSAFSAEHAGDEDHEPEGAPSPCSALHCVVHTVAGIKHFLLGP